MKKSEFLKDVQGLPEAELKAREQALAEELMKLRFRNASGQLEQGHRLREVKRNLARVKTCRAQKAQAAGSVKQ